jgi:hypothetical protein
LSETRKDFEGIMEFICRKILTKLQPKRAVKKLGDKFKQLLILFSKQFKSTSAIDMLFCELAN